MRAIVEKGEAQPPEVPIEIDDAILTVADDIGSSHNALELSAPPKPRPGSFIRQKG